MQHAKTKGGHEVRRWTRAERRAHKRTRKAEAKALAGSVPQKVTSRCWDTVPLGTDSTWQDPRSWIVGKVTSPSGIVTYRLKSKGLGRTRIGSQLVQNEEGLGGVVPEGHLSAKCKLLPHHSLQGAARVHHGKPVSTGLKRVDTLIGGRRAAERADDPFQPHNKRILKRLMRYGIESIGKVPPKEYTLPTGPDWESGALAL